MTEFEACKPVQLNIDNFNTKAVLPYGLEVDHIQKAMTDFIDFIGFLNERLLTKEMPRMECFLMPANFSSIVGEFMNITIPKYCPTIVKNRYHNGHPDLIPVGMFADDAVQHSIEGVEVKGSRYSSGWQGHNPEQIWLMVFHFDSNTASDSHKGVGPKPFKFHGVYLAKLDLSDWTFSGRSENSRRTITATVNRAGMVKMFQNWIYKDF